MTDFKAFSQIRDLSPTDRSVTVLLMPIVDGGTRAASALARLGPSTLLQIASRLLGDIEADEHAFCADGDELAAWFGQLGPSEARVLRPGEPRRSALREDRWGVGRYLHGVRTSHAMVLCAGSPFLRPSSASEAIRLFKMRLDIASLRACVRNDRAICDIQGRSLLGAPQEPSGPRSDTVTYRLLDTFSLFAVASSHPDGARGRSCAYDPYPFELSAMEGFVVDSDFALGLAAAYYERRTSGVVDGARSC